MNRRMLLMALFGTGSLLAQGRGNGKGKGKGKDKDKENRAEGRGGGPESSHFRREDYAVLERYYTGPRDLPPGLRKKYARTGTLPPGWQKKMRPFPPEVVRVLPTLPPNCAYGYIDGVAIVYNRTTRIILDSVDLIAAIAGH